MGSGSPPRPHSILSGAVVDAAGSPCRCGGANHGGGYEKQHGSAFPWIVGIEQEEGLQALAIKVLLFALWEYT